MGLLRNAVAIWALVLGCALGQAAWAQAAWAQDAAVPGPTPAPAALRVVLESARAPLSSRDGEGQAHGMAVEFWQRWSQRTGTPLSMTVLPLYDALQAVRQGRVDAMLEFAHAGKAPPGIRLGPAYATLPVSLFFSKKLSGIRALDDLTGLRLGVVAASAEADAVADRVPFGTVLVAYPTCEALVAGASLGEMHAFLAPEAAGVQYLASSGGLADFVQLHEPVLLLQVSVAVRDGGVGNAAANRGADGGENDAAADAAADAAEGPATDALTLLSRGMDEHMEVERRRIELAWRGETLARELPWRALGGAALALLGAVVGVLLWNRQLQRRVRRATVELRQVNAALEEEVRIRRKAEDELAGLNRMLECRIEERTRALGEKAAELQRANDRLQRMDEAKTAFLAAVSHELRTPLTSLRGFAKLICKEFERVILPAVAHDAGVTAKAHRIVNNLSIINAEGERLSRLVNDYLDLSRIEADNMPWRDVEIDPSSCVQRAVQAVAGQLADKPELDLQVDTAPALPRLLADPDRLEQVLINLLSNAIKFTSQGHVRLRTTAVDGMVRFAVEDTGVGVPQADRQRIFDKFERLVHDDTLQSSKAVGAGLGLAICRQIVEYYRGRIWVEGSQGSIFIVEIPAVQTTPTPLGAQPC